MNRKDLQYEAQLEPGYRDKSLIGIIQFSDILQEQEFGRVEFRNGLNSCKIEVYGSEANIPHFHIIGKDFKSCICIYSNNYFSHGGKYTGVLNSNNRKILNEWLKLPSPYTFNKITNWELIVSAWEISNPKCKFPESRKVKSQPDYSEMTNFKDA